MCVFARPARPVKVVPENITANMSVPVIVDSTHPVGDLLSGKSTEWLFDQAVAVGALVGAGLRLQCVGDDEGYGNTFVLVALVGNGESQRGATTGRQPTWRIGASDDDPTDQETLVREALDYFAAELNYAIAGWRLANRILRVREAARSVCVLGRR
ncbi:MAG TPA: hypothetical protein VGY76_10705 [Solirubrobacteraceae bacterium]|jgi:hypothetical protein|nr:hypothetical protein [Solirubrobacteraceae bacterium]